MVTENGPTYTTSFYMRLQKQSVYRTFIYFSHYKHGDIAQLWDRVKNIMPFFFFADCNKLKSKRFEWPKTNSSS